MIQVALMIEGQAGLNWPRLQRLAEAVEGLGYAGLFRSDHVVEPRPPDVDSLELWVSLTWLASHTKRIAFGPVVSPVSFRHPVTTARMASAVDDLSGGRLALGLGAGWNEREHHNYSYDLLDLTSRLDRFAEGLQVVKKLLTSDTPFEFNGEYYKLHEAILLPRPQRAGGPPITVGGNGPKRTLPLVARYGDEWNAVFSNAATVRERNQQLDELAVSNGRQPSAIRRSLMTGCTFGLTDEDVQRKGASQFGYGTDPTQLAARGIIYGTPNAVVEQLGKVAEAGVYRVMLQWLDLDDLDGIEAFAKTVLPQLK